MRDQAAEKRVSWAELLFDLVFVVAVTQVATLIRHHHGAVGLLCALVLLVPLHWTWVGASVLTNQQDVRGAIVLRVFAVALAGAFMALALERAFEGTGLGFSGGTGWVGRCWQAPSSAPCSAAEETPSNPYVVSLLVVGSRLDAGPRLAVWGAAALLDLSTPSRFRSRMRGMHFDAAHLASSC